MSSIRAVKVKCNKCGKEHDVVLNATINLVFDSEEAEKLVNGELNKLVCDSCGEVNRYIHPILVNDMGYPCRFIYFGYDKNENEDTVSKMLNMFSGSMYGEGSSIEPLKEYYNDWDTFIQRVKELM